MTEKQKQVPRCTTVQWLVTETVNRLDQMVVMVPLYSFRVAAEWKVKKWQRVN